MKQQQINKEDIEFGEIIRNGRKDAKLTQGDLAEKIGIKQPLVSKWESNENIPTGKELVKLGHILDIVPIIFPGYVKLEAKKKIEEDAKRTQEVEKQIKELQRTVAILTEVIKIVNPTALEEISNAVGEKLNVS